MNKFSCLQVILLLSVIVLTTNCSKKNSDPETDPNLPVVSTLGVMNITETTALGGGVVSDKGTSEIIFMGICWDTMQNPSIHSSIAHSAAGLGPFHCNMTGLKENHQYYVRAFATNNSGTAYGEQVSFKTAIDSGFATVITLDPVLIYWTFIEIGGYVVSNGLSPVSERGIVWNMTGHPVISDNKLACDSGTGYFYATLTGLESHTYYYIRAYAINSAGIAYGNEKKVYTEGLVYPVLFVPGDYQGWNPSDSGTVISSVGFNDHYEGYIWFPNDTTQYKYTSGPSWDENYGDNNADGSLELNGNNIVAVGPGYYKLNVDLGSLKHTRLRTEWGVLGTATANGWNEDINMTFDPVSELWKVTLNLSSGEIKFRANDSWDLNYGDNNGNGNLQQGGSDIPVSEAGNYTITLDLSKPIYSYLLQKNK